ncbi:tripartite tricarboxylate transporter TctB family protein, partial [Streptomyces zhihengii]
MPEAPGTSDTSETPGTSRTPETPGTPEAPGTPGAPPAGAAAWLRERSELGVGLLLALIGILVLTDAFTMDVDIAQRGPVGPRTV